MKKSYVYGFYFAHIIFKNRDKYLYPFMLECNKHFTIVLVISSYVFKFYTLESVKIPHSDIESISFILF